jgi:hypothetical protein
MSAAVAVLLRAAGIEFLLHTSTKALISKPLASKTAVSVLNENEYNCFGRLNWAS